jgi:hypothetical protein
VLKEDFTGEFGLRVVRVSKEQMRCVPNNMPYKNRAIDAAVSLFPVARLVAFSQPCHVENRAQEHTAQAVA